jgi:hypothetical protein
MTNHIWFGFVQKWWIPQTILFSGSLFADKSTLNIVAWVNSWHRPWRFCCFRVQARTDNSPRSVSTTTSCRFAWKNDSSPKITKPRGPGTKPQQLSGSFPQLLTIKHGKNHLPRPPNGLVQKIAAKDNLTWRSMRCYLRTSWTLPWNHETQLKNNQHHNM